ncbi:MAG: hypothetical protein IPM26_08315 [Saprospiraceae bacterium]|nr:hypothetical protein [Saprospiraceae bacterium]
MRILAEYDKDGIKVTVFQMNGRLSVKFEDNLLEQTFKFRDGSGIEQPEDVMKMTDESFMQALKSRFEEMNHSRTAALEKLWKETGEEFPEII